MKRRHKQKLKQWMAFLLALLSILAPCLSVIGAIRASGGTRQASAKSTEKKLPIYCVDTKGAKKVALTFDAAWSDEDADEILATLDQYKVKVTFFMVGDFIRKYPDLVKRIADAGHDIANHSNKHPHVNQMGKEEIKKDIMDAHQTIEEVTGQKCWLYRPPYGEYNNTVIEAAEECQYYTIQWDVDSIDWKGYDAPTIVRKVLDHKNLRDGSIVLLHNGADHTAEALPKIIEGLIEKGYELVPISELIYKEGYTLNHEGRQCPVQ